MVRRYNRKRRDLLKLCYKNALDDVVDGVTELVNLREKQTRINSWVEELINDGRITGDAVNILARTCEIKSITDRLDKELVGHWKNRHKRNKEQRLQRKLTEGYLAYCDQHPRLSFDEWVATQPK